MASKANLSVVVEEETDVGEGDENSANCGVCNKTCEAGSESLGCDLCSKWFHRECLAYNKSTYKAIIQLDEVKWFCKSCNEKANDTFSMIKMVMMRMDVLDARNTALEAKNAALEKRMLKIEKEREKEKEDNVPPSVGNSGNVVGTPVSAPANQQGEFNWSERISKELREIKEVEDRKTNFIITEIPELDSRKEDELAKLANLDLEQGDNEKQVVEKLLVKLEVRNVEIKEICRIPARREGQRSGQEVEKPRKLLVKLGTPKMQKAVLEKAKNLKNIEGWSTSYISPDLTKQQRDKAYQLRVEKRRRTQAGETNLIIRNGEVVVREVRPFRHREGDGP